MTIHFTCPEYHLDLPVENAHVCGKGSSEEKEAVLKQCVIAIHKKRGKCKPS